MKLVSWNVNGIRSVLGKGFYDFVAGAKADVICLQETKAREEQVGSTFEGYHAFWNSAERPGYSGTAILTKTKPLDVRHGIGRDEHDREGRVITAEFADFFLVNVYVPNSGRELLRLDYRTKAWGPEFLRFLKDLEKTKPVVFCGDLNVAHKEIDLARPKANGKNAGFTPEERAGFDSLIGAGFLDTFRELEKGGGHYSWWSYMGGARAKNVGWRIDYFCISPSLRPRLKDAFIWPHVMGSDHCPVGIVLE
ncbi:MAG: exodeoxyribonuclease III [Terrimicrobiaceae bacterium]